MLRDVFGVSCKLLQHRHLFILASKPLLSNVYDVGWKEKVLTSGSRAGVSARRCQSMWHPKGWSNSEKALARGSMVSGNSEPLASRKPFAKLLALAPCYN